MTRFAIIGFGEVGGIFARDLRAGGATAITAYDIAPAALERARATGAQVAESAAAAAAAADVVFVCVTAGSVPAAMRSLTGGLGHAPFVVDVNSVSPGTKQAAAATITAQGGRYVEAAVMASVPPKGLRSPILLGGPEAGAFTALMAPFGMDLTLFPGPVGKASAVKMCRSVMVKGLEALTTESMLAARHYGVEEEVLRSLSDTLPHPDWRGLARYVISRALIHGRRRAEEMREVARTVQEAGVEPLLSAPIAERQDWAAARGRAMRPEELATQDLDVLLSGIIHAVPAQAAE
ncbi:prephenate dehydrogenase/arogenate dehydrogenase family protein [Roseomonas sp. GC11]|uniref:NAD(P)-dependent oxidoreductase n=1 Tax=Roseomonas sp. GC11 TaxID=2950546 RepID=UPI00210AF337|nr:NAD(P)-dependent oxidoreductase [Roseomonas sp. GC11]MCQ4159282.1 prephenate dehydrogenase/arogenate dehydrogenase family protein [Roseomonas sp. GC11]